MLKRRCGRRNSYLGKENIDNNNNNSHNSTNVKIH